MSLINEALKKAQRARHEETAAAQPAPDGPVVKRPQPKSAQSMLLLAVAGVVLVVLSMVGTALWLTKPAPRPTEPRLSAGSTTAPTPAAPAPASASPAAAPDVLKPVALVLPSPPKESSTAPAAPASKPPSTAPAPAAVAPAAAPPPPEPPKAEPDARVQKLVDSLRVTGIRSSGTESKVLMNDRVYRVNDFVDRVLGVKLVTVTHDTLTFTDANGVTYVKNF